MRAPTMSTVLTAGASFTLGLAAGWVSFALWVAAGDDW